MIKQIYLLVLLFPFIIKSQCDENEYEIILETITDEWAEEMSWELLDNEGNEITSFQGYENDQEYTETICLNTGCYAINAIDSYGDGWNGGSLAVLSNNNVDFGNGLESLLIEPQNGYGFYTFFSVNASDCEFSFVGCTDQNASNYDIEAAVDDGSCTYADCLDEESLIIIETQTGEWASEMSWDLYSYENWSNGSNNIITNFQGTNDDQTITTQLCLNSGCYMFYGYDSYGDGWQGGSINVSINGVALDDYYVENSFGYFTFEIDIKSCNWEFPGCMDEAAYNYNEFATIDDGSCISPLTFNWDNIDREYLLYTPPNLSKNAPLVFVFHGYTGSALDIMNYCNMNEVANENGFAVCYPQGTQDQYGNNFFNVGYDFQNNPEVDDLGFTIALAEHLQEAYQLSNINTFSTGMSNGGDFSYLLACQASGTFRAIAPVAGLIMEEIYNNCIPSSVPVFETHGTDDDVSLYEGDPNNEDGWGAYLDIPTTIDYFVEQNNLPNLFIDTIPNNAPWDNSIIERHIYSSEDSSNEVWLYKVIGGGHDWPGSWGNMDVNISEEIWRFFSQMSLPEEMDIEEINTYQTDKTLLQTTDILGRQNINQGFQIKVYSDGSVEKSYVIF